ncbi:hypothetical protein IFM89_038211 [Coptis chinensis]|uniref:RRM domain-containing protein n=1 Tax=Coptis chinensis TaxID=261450 RepID=A0A835MBI5_9MAGN|nr:hypothetical protein IFM89_038211 [Coptis chinensis]
MDVKEETQNGVEEYNTINNEKVEIEHEEIQEEDEEEEEEEEERGNVVVVDYSAGDDDRKHNHHDERGGSSSPGKIFVGGVSWDTTEENFTKHFEKYGEIIDSVIMKEKHTRRPRGFGFITFSNPSVLDKVLEDEHIINGRTVEVKRTVPREDMEVKGSQKTKKIFVGGIPPSITEDELKEYFSSYGNIVEQQIMLDHSSGRSRGFGFVTFESEEAVEQIINEDRTHELGGKQVEIKKAEPKRGGGDRGSDARDRYGGGFASSYGTGASGFGSGYRSGGGYGGRSNKGYGGYGRGYGAGPASSYDAYGGYSHRAGYGGPMYGNGEYGDDSYSSPGGYGAGYGGAGYYGGSYGAGGYGGSYGTGGYGGGYGGEGAAAYGGVGGGSSYGGVGGAGSYGSGAGGRGYGSGSAARGRYHPYGR